MLIVASDWGDIIWRHTVPLLRSTTVRFCECTCEQLYEENYDTSWITHPSFCMTTQGHKQLWLSFFNRFILIPDISPCDYDLIPKMTAPLQGRFRTVNGVLQATDRSLRNLPRLGTLSGIQRLPHRWDACYATAVITLKGCKHATYVPKICIDLINSCNY